MTTEREQYLLARCLRLEAEIAELRGYAVDEIAPPPPRTAASIVPIVLCPRPIYRNASESDIAQMRALRARGLSPFQIGLKVGFSDSTVRSHTKDVLQEREVGS